MKKSITLSLVVILMLTYAATDRSYALAPSLVPHAAPEVTGKPWLNSSPLSLSQLRGRVVLVEFWTFGCYNCVNVEPYVKKWYEQYKAQGLEIIAVHSPEFSHERDADNVRAYIERKGISYPVVMDNDFAIWRRYSNQYWPAMYLIDKQGQIRYRHIGEGRYTQTEQMIRQLLAEKP